MLENKMKNFVFLHIPHSSTRFPNAFKRDKKILSNKEIDRFNLCISDLYTDQLFNYKKYPHLKVKFSRVFCDVEKFVDDNIEEMAQYGMGVVYTHTEKGEKFFEPTKDYKEKVLKKYYNKAHKKLDEKIEKAMKNHKVILVDCHSFSREIIMKKSFENLPDICIGINKDYSSKVLVDFTMNFMNSFGLTTMINYPYVGSMIPDSLLNKSADNFFSIMIEINRNLYLKNYKKTKNFKKIKKIIGLYLKKLKNLEF